VYVVLNVATADATDGNSYFGLAIGFTVLAGAFAVGQVSGAAFNPAVAIGASIRGLLPWSTLWLYIVAELLGGAAASFVFKALNPTNRPGPHKYRAAARQVPGSQGSPIRRGTKQRFTCRG
jgi:aquaporin Z